MTYDELLACLKPEYGYGQVGDALRAVVELHKPEGDRQQQCEHDKKTYPCPTIQAIEEQLK